MSGLPRVYSATVQFIPGDKVRVPGAEVAHVVAIRITTNGPTYEVEAFRDGNVQECYFFDWQMELIEAFGVEA